MICLSDNLKRYRIMKNLTQEEVARYLGITPQSISKWERGECYPDITLLPALAIIFETSIDLLIGMDAIRAVEARYNIHKKATEFLLEGDFASAERVYSDALRLYPNDSGMVLGLAGVVALLGRSAEAIEHIERGLSLSANEKQKSTMRAVLCFLYLKCGKSAKANELASELPHIRESREVIQPLIQKGLDDAEIQKKIVEILLGEGAAGK